MKTILVLKVRNKKEITVLFLNNQNEEFEKLQENCINELNIYKVFNILKEEDKLRILVNLKEVLLLTDSLNEENRDFVKIMIETYNYNIENKIFIDYINIKRDEIITLIDEIIR